MNKQEVKNRIQKYIETNILLKEKIQKLSLFGSYLDDTLNQKNDIDLLIEFSPSVCIGFFELTDIKQDFESFLNKKIDLVTPQALSKYLKSDIINQAEIIYEK